MPRTALTRAIKLLGTNTPDGKRRQLAAGPLTAVLDSGALRYIRYNGVEVLRGIAFLVRDRNWGTYAPVITRLKVKKTKDGFTINYDATCRDEEQEISYTAKVTASADGVLKFAAEATPATDFLTNRTGFVVLHPLDGVTGKPVDVVHTDGRRERRAFPKLISPGQPIFEIRSLKHTVMPGVTTTVLMEGNKFEMEDHRNWMDASYKTYVCSLLDPWPYTLAKGQAFTQSITLTMAGKPPVSKARRAEKAITIALGNATGRMPAIGTGVPMAEAGHALAKANLIAAAKPAHLVCQIDGRQEGQARAADAFRRLSEKTGIPVTLEVILPAREEADAEAKHIADAVRQGGLVPRSVVITQMHDLKSFQPNAARPWGPGYEKLARAARAAFPDVPIGGGMLSYFTELNRKRPPRGLFDFITHSVCPIVHAADDVSVMETLESLPSIFASTRAMIGTSPYHLGPSSIPCRDNPYGAAVAPNPANGRVCLADVDPRQRGLFAAAWYLGLVAAAARGGIDALALGGFTGPQGVVGEAAGRKGLQLYPAYHVLAGLAAASGSVHLNAQSSAPSAVAAVAHRSGTRAVVWLANLTPETQTIKTGDFPAATVHILDESCFVKASTNPDFLNTGGARHGRGKMIELQAYGIARLVAV